MSLRHLVRFTRLNTARTSPPSNSTKTARAGAIGSSVWMTYVDRRNSSHIVFLNGIVQEWQSNLLCVKTDYILTVFIISFCTCNPIETRRPPPERRTSSKQILITVRERRTAKTHLLLCLVRTNKVSLWKGSRDDTEAFSEYHPRFLLSSLTHERRDLINQVLLFGLADESLPTSGICHSRIGSKRCRYSSAIFSLDRTHLRKSTNLSAY